MTLLYLFLGAVACFSYSFIRSFRCSSSCVPGLVVLYGVPVFPSLSARFTTAEANGVSPDIAVLLEITWLNCQVAAILNHSTNLPQPTYNFRLCNPPPRFQVLPEARFVGATVGCCLCPNINSVNAQTSASTRSGDEPSPGTHSVI